MRRFQLVDPLIPTEAFPERFEDLIAGQMLFFDGRSTANALRSAECYHTDTNMHPIHQMTTGNL